MHQATEILLDRLVQFKLAYETTSFLLQRAKASWASVENEFEAGAPTEATGIVANRDSLQEESHRRFEIRSRVGSDTVFSSLSDMPLEPAAISYVFTQLELYGDFVVSVINKSFFAARNSPKNWHSRIHGDTDIRDAAKLLRMRSALAAPFRMEVDDIPMFTVAEVIELKRVRNEFAHEGRSSANFDVLFSYAADLICQIHFWVLDDEEMIIRWPFRDESEEVDDARELNAMIKEMKQRGEW
ncbi:MULTISPECIES: hypothetical protein [Bradyrhizobium]|uniref:hypothetical protein n=1 Tax=Bradyrhizobium TaxID=374 RepID=UPI00155E4284|nr:MULTISPECIES: hypothetical protein [Bradyrhizobium]UUO27692.1 hypothetical protein DCG74_10610 [Bradyrhizobium sp. WBAH42]